MIDYFSYNLIKALFARNCIYLQSKHQLCSGNLGWSNDILRSKLTTVLNCFEKLAFKKGKLPIIIFIPRDLDIESPRYRDFMNDYISENNESILIDTSINVPNIKEFHNTVGGHASSYGNNHIADLIAKKLGNVKKEDIISAKIKNKDSSVIKKDSFCRSIYSLANNI